MVNTTETQSVCPVTQLDENHRDAANSLRKTGVLRQLVRLVSQYYLPRNTGNIPRNPRSVVVLTGGNLGGTILSLPLVKATRERFPNAHLAVVCNTEVGREFMEFFGVGDSFHAIRSDSLQSLAKIKNYITTTMKISREKPEVLVSNHNCGNDPLLIPLRIPIRIGNSGIDLRGRPIDWSYIYNVLVPMQRDMNWLDTYRQIGNRIGAELDGPPSITVPEDLKAWAAQTLKDCGVGDNENCVALQVGVWAPQSWKQWPVTKLADLCSNIWSQHGMRPVLIGDQSGIRSYQELKKLIPDVPVLSFLGSTSVPQAAAIIDQCKASVCNDSGLMHLSAAVGTPTVAVYGMTDPDKTWCYPPPHRVVRRQDILPCYHLDNRILEGCQHRMCLAQLDADIVEQAVIEAIEFA